MIIKVPNQKLSFAIEDAIRWICMNIPGFHMILLAGWKPVLMFRNHVLLEVEDTIFVNHYMCPTCHNLTEAVATIKGVEHMDCLQCNPLAGHHALMDHIHSHTLEHAESN